MLRKRPQENKILFFREIIIADGFPQGKEPFPPPPPSPFILPPFLQPSGQTFISSSFFPQKCCASLFPLSSIFCQCVRTLEYSTVMSFFRQTLSLQLLFFFFSLREIRTKNFLFCLPFVFIALRHAFLGTGEKIPREIRMSEGGMGGMPKTYPLP